jgi:hypothetical protein
VRFGIVRMGRNYLLIDFIPFPLIPIGFNRPRDMKQVKNTRVTKYKTKQVQHMQ